MSCEQEAGGKIQGVGFGKNVEKTEAVPMMSHDLPSAGVKRVPVVSNREEMIKSPIGLGGISWEELGGFVGGLRLLLDEEPS